MNLYIGEGKKWGVELFIMSFFGIFFWDFFLGFFLWKLISIKM